MVRRWLACALVAACGGSPATPDAAGVDAPSSAFPGCAPTTGEVAPACTASHFCWVSPSRVVREVRSVSGGGCDYWLAGDAIYRLNGGTVTPVAGSGVTDAIWVFPTEVWTAGSATRRFDGTTWTTVEAQPAHGVWGSAPDDVWIARDVDIARWDGQALRSVRSLDSPSVISLWGTAPDDVRIVDGPTIVHWNGADWSHEPVDGQPLALWGAAADDWYAAGRGPQGAGAIWHFDGATWSRVLDQPDALYAVWGTAGDDVWAGGEGDHVLHFDGTTWTTVPLVEPALVLAIRGTSRDDVVFGGFELVARWDGTQVSPVATTIPLAPGETAWAAMYGASPSDVWLVADHGTVAHWDGTTWRTSRIAAEPIDVLAMTGAAGEVWIAGAQAGRMRVWRRNGAGFDATDLATPGQVRATYAASASDAWAAGDGGAIFHFDGTRWQRTPAPTMQTLLGIWGSASDAWAVGGFTVLHWNGSAWSKLSVVGGGPYTAVWGRAANEVYIGGASGALMSFDGDHFKLRSVASAPLRALGGTATLLWAASDDAVILDRGTGPSALATPTGSWFGAYFPSRSDGWIAGSGGTVMRYQP